MTIDAIIDEALKLDAERTQGEWTHHPDPGKDCPECGESDCEGELITYKPNNCNDVGIAVTLTDARCVKNAEFMCHAANNYAAMCRRVRELEAENERLRSQLPDGMQHCTIRFKSCPLGHGWLTADNWVQHRCPTCERNNLREAGRELYDEVMPHAYEARARWNEVDPR